VSLAITTTASADPATSDVTTGTGSTKDIRSEVPILAYTYNAVGVSKGTYGVQAYGLGVGGGGGGQRSILGGGATVWGSPIDRLTLVGDGSRDVFGNFAPSAAAIVRLFGTPNDGFALGAIGKFKVDGFGVGPNNEIESEIEGGLLMSYVKYGWHLDLNAITGFGTGDDAEVDTEGRFRFGKDLGSMWRLGIDAQGRYRLNGANPVMPNGRWWDAAGGPQLMLGSSKFFGALTAGPSTMGIVSGVGATGIITIGGATL
jgi:hypothetical protein